MGLLLALFTASFSKTKYGIMIDAGSSGTRAHIYTWESGSSIPNVAALRKDGKEQVTKSKIPLAKAVKNANVIDDIFKPIISFAKDAIPPDYHTSTRIFVYATAGMRLLPQIEQRQVISATLDYLRKNSPFKLKERYVKVLSGIEEGIFGWLSVNHLSGRFNGKTIGALDMGGASLQIAVECLPGEETQNVRVGNKVFPLFSYSYLSFGANEALKKTTQAIAAVLQQTEIQHPCFNAGLEGKQKGITYKGTGSFDKCLALADGLLVESPEFSSVNIPSLSATKEFVAMASFFYLNDFLKLNENSTLQDLKNATSKMCSTTWKEMEKQYPGNEYVKSYCWYGVYQYAILTKGFEFKDGDTLVRKTETLNDTDLSWTIGAMLSEVSEIEIEDDVQISFKPNWQALPLIPAVLLVLFYTFFKRGKLSSFRRTSKPI